MRRVLAEVAVANKDMPTALPEGVAPEALPAGTGQLSPVHGGVTPAGPAAAGVDAP